MEGGPVWPKCKVCTFWDSSVLRGGEDWGACIKMRAHEGEAALGMLAYSWTEITTRFDFACMMHELRN